MARNDHFESPTHESFSPARKPVQPGYSKPCRHIAIMNRLPLIVLSLLATISCSAIAKKPVQLDCVDSKYANDPSSYSHSFRFLMSEDKKEIRRLNGDGRPSSALKAIRWDGSNISVEWEHLSPVEFYKRASGRSAQESMRVSSRMSFSIDRIGGGFMAFTVPVTGDRVLPDEEAKQLFTNEPQMSFFDFLVLHRQSFSGKCIVAKSQF